MDSYRFGHIIKKYILPLMPNACTYAIESGEFPHKFPVEYHESKSIVYLYPDISNTQGSKYRYRLLVSIYRPSIIAANLVLSEILNSDRDFLSGNKKAGNQRQESYLDTMRGEACVLGICEYLLPNIEDLQTRFVLRGILRALSNWAARTYEGRRYPFGFLFNPGITVNWDEPENYLEFLNDDNSAVFSDGVFSAIMLDQTGNIVEHRQLELRVGHEAQNSFDDVVLAPTRFIAFAELCVEKIIGVSCLPNGDMLIFKNRQIVFAWRRGGWGAYNWANISSFLRECVSNEASPSNALTEKLIKSIYISVLDVLFAHTGGCLAIVDMNKYDADEGKPLNNCLLREMPCFQDEPDKEIVMRRKCKILRRLVTYNDTSKNTVKFHELSDKLRLELQSLDGAMVIDREGYMQAIGAILSVDPGSEGGGRLAAAKKLATYGLGIKISEDGAIRAFKWSETDRKVIEVLRLV